MYNIEDDLEVGFTTKQESDVTQAKSCSPIHDNEIEKEDSNGILYHSVLEKHKRDMHTYDYKPLDRDMRHYEAIFTPFKDIEIGDKLSFEKDCFYVSKSFVFQGVTRWYQSQNRADVFVHLLHKYEEYKTYIEKIHTIVKQVLSNQCVLLENPNSTFTFIPQKVIDLNKIMIDACLALQQTYLDDTELSGKFMLMSNFLIFFNTKLQAALQDIELD